MTNELLLNVDDDLAGRYAISRVLRHAGYEVLEASTIQQALALIEERHPALVLLDVNLPDGNGLELSARIKADAATTDIVVLQHSASFVRPQDQARGLREGADGYLTIPADPEVLLATVQAFLRTRKAEKALRESAEQWRTTFDAISDAVALFDVRMRCTRCNRSFAALVGREIGGIAGTSWAHLLPGVALPASLDSAAASRPGVDTELRYRDRWYRMSVDPIRSPEHGLQGYVCVLSDIDIRKAMDEERRQLLERERRARADAEAAARAKDEFLAVLSHELRTPLNAVLGWARMLSVGGLDAARTRHAVDTIERNARAQAQLIEDLLDVSRAVSGHLPLDPAPVDVLAVVTSAIDVVQIAASAKGVAVHLAAGEPAPRLLADEVRLRQVVWNLLSNAIKFTPSGGRIDVGVRAAGRCAEISVRDTGIGIPPDALPYIFDRFWQEHERGGRPAGLGLGLSIVRHLVEAHGGHVEALSDGPGQGATFIIRIPLISERT